MSPISGVNNCLKKEKKRNLKVLNQKNQRNMEDKLLRHPSLIKVSDQALWMNHNHRYDDNYGVVQSSQGDYMVLPISHPSFNKRDFETLPKNYSKMTYKHIQLMRTDDDPLYHWEEIVGMFSTLHGEILRFILYTKIPLERFIRYELGIRGYDKDFNWIGFEKSEKLWMK